MGISEFYGKRNDNESIKTLHRAYELGVTFWDTADGPYINEELIGKALEGKRQNITLTMKLGNVRDIANKEYLI